MPCSGKRRSTSTDTPASLGVQGPGDTSTRSGAALEQLVDGRHVVAHDLGLGAQLAQVLDEVVGERVVVVDDEDAPHAHSRCLQASSMAAITAPAFASVSRTS